MLIKYKVFSSNAEYIPKQMILPYITQTQYASMPIDNIAYDFFTC